MRLQRPTRVHILSTLTAFAFALPLAAQQPASQETQPPPPGSIYTLHVYTNLMQMPTMVLDYANHPITGLVREQFRLTLDGGPVFHPTQMHREDAEPLLFGVLLDASGTEPDLVKRAPEALASLASGSLTSRDQMAVFAFDCHIIGPDRTTAIESAAIRDATQQVLSNPRLHQSGAPKSGCPRTSHLIDSIAESISSIDHLGTRRVLVVITDGFDHESRHNWDELTQFATSTSTAIFIIRSGTHTPMPFEAPDLRASLGSLRHLSTVSGGLVLEGFAGDLPKTLSQIVTLLRSRYVLEFPRPSNTTAGFHSVAVKIASHDLRTLPTGASAPPAGDQELNDPNTIQGDPSRAPVIGNHAPQMPPH